ncbi:MAG: bifunctional folylpolyglutamate synthase/dihydrofolate synthase [Clostridia bacterium]|nr:bifunctional folylpolyglutamate synthase/dihydrofolate synthase [Clostridia bacterium]
MNYSEALDYIHKISWTGSRPGLERISELCALLGDPQDKLKFIHVGGTNGKGSFCSMLSSVLMASGLKVGTYTSPYIYRFNERIMINGSPIADDVLARLTERVKTCADKMADPPTEFELITALGFLYFAEEECDIVVLEVGLGGRLDATNIIKTPILSVITGIALDHTAILGDTVEKIAAEKAGIIKAGVPVLCGCPKESGAAKVIAARAKEMGCEMRYAKDAPITAMRCVLGETRFDYKSYTDVKIRLCGLYQPYNCAAVLDAVTLLNERGTGIDDVAVYRGLKNARWPARFEILSRDPDIIFDGGHNPEGIAALWDSVSYYYPGLKVIMLSGVMADKDYPRMAESLAPLAHKVHTFAPANPRALDAAKYSAAFEKCGVCAVPHGTARCALEEAIEDAKKTDLPLIICGSLYSYAEIRAELDEIMKL